MWNFHVAFAHIVGFLKYTVLCWTYRWQLFRGIAVPYFKCHGGPHVGVDGCQEGNGWITLWRQSKVSRASSALRRAFGLHRSLRPKKKTLNPWGNTFLGEFSWIKSLKCVIGRLPQVIVCICIWLLRQRRYFHGMSIHIPYRTQKNSARASDHERVMVEDHFRIWVVKLHNLSLYSRFVNEPNCSSFI